MSKTWRCGAPTRLLCDRAIGKSLAGLVISGAVTHHKAGPLCAISTCQFTAHGASGGPHARRARVACASPHWEALPAHLHQASALGSVWRVPYTRAHMRYHLRVFWVCRIK